MIGGVLAARNEAKTQGLSRGTGGFSGPSESRLRERILGDLD